MIRSRHLQSILTQYAKKFKVLTVTGPRQSGKTTLCRLVFKKLPYFNLEFPDVRAFAVEDPRGFLEPLEEGAIIDEIQRVPELVSYLQGIVDEPKFKGVFVLTGSQNFLVKDTLSQSLAGRNALFTLLPFSIKELPTLKAFTLNDYLYSGFYPRIYDKKLNPTKTYADYLATYVERDLRSMSAIKDLFIFQKFMRLCAGRVGQLLNYEGLANEVGVSATTIKEWITLLEASYILYRLPPFFENVGKRLIKSPKIYFYDVGLASFLIGIDSVNQIPTHPLRGNLFENMVISEIKKSYFNRGIDKQLYFFRDNNGLEVDLLIPQGDRYIPLEIKSSSTFHADFIKNIEKIRNVIKAETEGIVVYGGDKTLTFKGVQVTKINKLSIT